VQVKLYKQIERVSLLSRKYININLLLTQKKTPYFPRSHALGKAFFFLLLLMYLNLY